MGRSGRQLSDLPLLSSIIGQMKQSVTKYIEIAQAIRDTLEDFSPVVAAFHKSVGVSSQNSSHNGLKPFVYGLDMFIKSLQISLHRVLQK